MKWNLPRGAKERFAELGVEAFESFRHTGTGEPVPVVSAVDVQPGAVLFNRRLVIGTRITLVHEDDPKNPFRFLMPDRVVHRSRSRYTPHQGKRECARRQRQQETA